MPDNMVPFKGKSKYMGAWRYVLLDILYCIPVLGWIFLIYHALRNRDDDKDTSIENRMHYARSYFARLLLVLILVGIGLTVFYFVAGSDIFVAKLEELLEAMKSQKSPF